MLRRDERADPISTARIVKPDMRYLHASSAKTIARVLRSVLRELESGATSAHTGAIEGLSYADGWSAAVTLAKLTAADAMRAEIAPQ